MSSWTTLTIAAPNAQLSEITTALETHSNEDPFTTTRDNAHINTASIRFNALKSDTALSILASISNEHDLLYGIITLAEDTSDTASVTVWTQTEAGLEQDFAHLFPGNPRGGLSNIAVTLEQTHCVNAPTEP